MLGLCLLKYGNIGVRLTVEAGQFTRELVDDAVATVCGRGLRYCSIKLVCERNRVKTIHDEFEKH